MAEYIKTEKTGHVLVITFNRPKENNAFNTAMLRELGAAYAEMESDSEIRVGLVQAEGKHFTLGLELNEVAEGIRKNGTLLSGKDGIDPWAVSGRVKTKPVVVAAHGFCLTLGIELMLASDVRIATPSTKFGQMEVQRGVFPFGGATMRFPAQCGWGNAMKYMLTGEMFPASEALRIGLIQEIVEQPKLRERALQIASTIAEQSPLAVRATLASSRLAAEEGFHAAAKRLYPDLMVMLESEDAAEGIRSFQEKRKAKFSGR
jgi:enoyl-CoA hydratase/carnithine racemase